ncbi:hypothetical protein BH23ACI1_BH23ACI1_01290 [soil metagenome]
MRVRSLLLRTVRLASVGFVLALACGQASAQTLQISQSHATVIRGGTFANTNFATDPKLATRASGDVEFVRRIVMKFDTENPIPANTPIASAKLTVTIAGGNAENRSVAAYRVANSFERVEATWNRRKTGTTWSKAGGDLAEVWATQTVTHNVGTRVTYDVTALVQAAVNGKFNSRHTRIALVDTGASSRDSYKEYFSASAVDSSVRPTLTVTLGTTTTTTTAPAPSTGSATVRFVHWNIHHGVGTDGVYNLDRIATWIAKTNPNVVSLNEVERFTSWGNEDQPARFAALLKAKTGKTWHYHFASKSGTANGQGNLLLSTFPIEASASRILSFTRSVAQIRIVVNGRNLNVFSTHLDADSASRRATQMTELKSWMLQFPEQRFVGGDFNTWPSAGEITSMTVTYFDVWAEAVQAGTAVAYSGNTNGATRNNRIDYVFLSKGATSTAIKGAQVFDVRDASGVMPSDHRPLLAILEVK